MNGKPSSNWFARYGLVLALVVLCGGLAILSPKFLTWQNIIIVLRQISINGVLAVGVTFVLLTGGVDLSLGSLVALTGVVAASFAHPDQGPVVIPIAMGVAAGGLCGLLNGFVVTFGRVAPFITTLGMMTAARGLALLLSGGKPVSNLTQQFTWIGRESLLGIPLLVVVFALVATAAYVFLGQTRPGRHIYAVGGNEKAALASGIHVTRVKLAAYGLCGACAGLAGVLLAARLTTGQPNAGVAYELDAIAAAVIGGTSLSGGVGTIGGTVVGALLMGVIGNGLDLLNVPAYYQQVIKGVIIVGAVWLDKRQRR